MEQQIENKEGLSWEKESPIFGFKPSKKHLLIIWGIITLLMIGFLVYQFGWKKVENKIYQKGYQAGLNQGTSNVWQGLSVQYQMFGRLELPAKNPDGTDGMIIFMPQTPQ